MGKVFTYTLEGDPSQSFMDMRLRGLDEHLVFTGDDREGEFCQRFPTTGLELRGLYTIEDDLMSVIVTRLPEGHTHDHVEELFQRLMVNIEPGS